MNNTLFIQKYQGELILETRRDWQARLPTPPFFEIPFPRLGMPFKKENVQAPERGDKGG